MKVIPTSSVRRIGLALAAVARATERVRTSENFIFKVIGVERRNRKIDSLDD